MYNYNNTHLCNYNNTHLFKVTFSNVHSLTQETPLSQILLTHSILIYLHSDINSG